MCNTVPASEHETSELLETWSSKVRTRSGLPVRLRPLRADDRERELMFVALLSARSRYHRFGMHLGVPSPQLIEQLMDVDYVGRMAFAATVEHEGQERFVGVARYAMTGAPHVAEVGLSVADEVQRCGIATLLLAQLARFARWRGIQQFVAVVSPDNEGMIGFARALGFALQFDREQHLYRITYQLQ